MGTTIDPTMLFDFASLIEHVPSLEALFAPSTTEETDNIVKTMPAHTALVH